MQDSSGFVGRRRIGWSAILLLALVVAARVFSLQGFFKPVRIASGSMAPTFLGPRCPVVCADCGYGWSIDAAQVGPDQVAVCANCGYSGNGVMAAASRPGARVLIDRGAFWLRRPRRFDLVALADPLEASRLAVKRIVALPGERLEVRGGELYVNGRLVRKSLTQMRAMAVPVYDDRFRPRDLRLARRWQGAGTDWTVDGPGYQYIGDFQPASRSGVRPQLAWLSYHHWRCSALPGFRAKLSPVLDDYGYNLGPARQLNRVTDLLLQARLQTTGPGCLAVRLHDGRELWEILLWPKRGQAALYRDGRQTASGVFLQPSEDAWWTLEAAICDRQILAAVAGREIFAHGYEPSSAERRPSSQPVALGAAGLAVKVTGLLVSRDVYYLPPPGRPTWELTQPLGEGEYVLLGDNAAISLDSRAWTPPHVDGYELLGRVRHLPFTD